MTSGVIRIDRNRGLHFANRHFDLTGEDMQPPQGEMRHRFVGVERCRLFGRRSPRRYGFCHILSVAERHQGTESISEVSMGRREPRVECDRFPE